jgi:hypothetical protein
VTKHPFPTNTTEPDMHSYNTRFAAMNRSFGRAADDDAEYVPSHNVPSGGRRPVTRSMTRAMSATHPVELTTFRRRRGLLAPRPAAPATLPTLGRNHPVTRSMAAASSAQNSELPAAPERRVTRSMAAAASSRRTGSTHPMVLRSARR